AWCASAWFNSRVFAASWVAGDDAPLCPARAFAFVTPERVRPPRLRLLAFDSPRLICRRPWDSVGRKLDPNIPQKICCRITSRTNRQRMHAQIQPHATRLIEDERNS